MAPTQSESSLDQCEFLADYSARLLGCGATCIRIEKNIDRIARTWNKSVSLTIMPRHVLLSLMDKDGGNAVTVNSPMAKGPISYELNSNLSRLSWQINDNRMPFAEAKSRYDRLTAPHPQSRAWVLFAVACANAAFCRLFGGDLMAMAVVAVATLAGYYIKQVLLERHVDTRVVWMVCALVSSVLGASDGLFHLGDTPDVAIATSVLYLVPGIPFINSFSDLIDGHYICAFSRFIDATILTACLSVGLCCGMALMNVGMF